MTEEKVKKQTRAERIKALQAKVKQMQALEAKEAARARLKSVGENRKIETRKYVVIGAFVSSVMKNDGVEAASMTFRDQPFDKWLKRPDERALFGLAPLPMDAT